MLSLISGLPVVYGVAAAGVWGCPCSNLQTSSARTPAPGGGCSAGPRRRELSSVEGWRGMGTEKFLEPLPSIVGLDSPRERD